MYAWAVASYGNHLLLMQGESVQALPGIGEIIALDKDMLFLKPVQRIPHRPRRQRGLADEVFLGELLSALQHFVHELCRWRQVPDLIDFALLVCVYDKNDPS